ncbi:MAG: hypothetical protein Q9222_002009 [Ikaeria aurantiellina]
MSLKTLNAKDATDLDKDLMSVGAFSLDQLMELAGLSVSQTVYSVHPPGKGKRVLIAVGPGNNGGDGLVAARHLWHYGYSPTIFYPKQSKNELYQRLSEQLKNLGVPFTDDFDGALKNTDHVVDSIFGFSFSGEVREPFAAVITAMENTKVPVTAVDAPSSWSIEDGPPKSGPGAKFHPETLISLTAPKPLVSHFKGRHFVGGRFLPPSVAEKYHLDIPDYKGVDQIVEVPAGDNAQPGKVGEAPVTSSAMANGPKVESRCTRTLAPRLEYSNSTWRIDFEEDLHESSARVQERSLVATRALDLAILADFFASQPRGWQLPHMLEGNWVAAGLKFTTGDYTRYQNPDDFLLADQAPDILDLTNRSSRFESVGLFSSGKGKSDCFHVLPIELRLMILCYLPSGAVEAVRQASNGMGSVPLEGTFWFSRLSEPEYCHLTRRIAQLSGRHSPGDVPDWFLALQSGKTQHKNRVRIIEYNNMLVDKMLQRQLYLKEGHQDDVHRMATYTQLIDCPDEPHPAYQKSEKTLTWRSRIFFDHEQGYGGRYLSGLILQTRDSELVLGHRSQKMGNKIDVSDQSPQRSILVLQSDSRGIFDVATVKATLQVMQLRKHGKIVLNPSSWSRTLGLQAELSLDNRIIKFGLFEPYY